MTNARVGGWMERLGWLGLAVGNPLFALAAVGWWSRHVLFAHCHECASLAWEHLCANAEHIIVVVLVLGLGFLRSAMHRQAARRVLVGDPAERRQSVHAFVAVGVLHALAVSVAVRHATTPVVALLLAWPIALLALSREAPLPAVRVVRLPSR